MEQAYQAHWWMKTYPGMTPDKVDELPAAVYARLPAVAALHNEWIEEQRDRG